MEKYIAAWTTNEPDDIRALFTEDAVYATRPLRSGRLARARADRGTLADRGRTSPRNGPLSGRRSAPTATWHFVQGRTHYLGDRPSYENLWVIRLGPDGRASAFTEWFMERKV